MGLLDKEIQDILNIGNLDLSKYEKEKFSIMSAFMDAKSKIKTNLDNLAIPVSWFPTNASLSNNSNGFLAIQGNVVPSKNVDENNCLAVLDDMLKKIYSLNNLFHILREVTSAEKTRYFERLTEDYFNFCSYYNTIVTIGNNLDYYMNCRNNSIENEMNKLRNKANNDLMNKENIINELKEKLTYNIDNSYKYLIREQDISFQKGDMSKFLLGLNSEDLSSTSKKFLSENMGFSTSDFSVLSSVPKYLDLTREGGSILVKTSASNMSSQGLSEFIENIILSYQKVVGASKVKLCGVESNFNTRVTAVLTDFMRSNASFSYNKTGVVKRDNEIQNLLDSLIEEVNKREMVYSSNGFYNIYDYNNKNSDNEHDTILLFINDYPTSLDSRNSPSEVIQKIEYLINKGKDMGVYLVVFENEDDKVYETANNYREGMPKLNERLFAAVLDEFNVTSKTYICDDARITYDIREKGFNLKNYLISLAKEEKEENRFYLSKFLDEINRKNIKYSANDSKIKIPVGKINNEIYNFETDSSAAPSAMVLGGTGSGKSSFLHTLILSAASIYTPDELEFYVADFKNSGKTTDGPTFTVYQKDSEYYVPHIKYMSTIGSIENTRDILDVIETLKNKRAKLFRQVNGCEDVVGYNNSNEVKSGKLPRMSRIIFIIDEFNNMFGENEGNSDDEALKSELKRMLKSALTTVRAFGICILFSGQSNTLDGTSASQVKTKVLLSDARHNFMINENYTKAVHTKGNAIFYDNVNADLVKIVYTGSFNSPVSSDVEEKKKIVRSIQEKYKDKDYEQSYARDNKEVGISNEKELFKLIEEDREDFESLNGYTVYMGRSFGADEPVSIYFSTQSDTQYSIVAPLTQLSKIERNVMLGFLTTTVVLDKNKANKSISYCKIDDNESDSANCLDDFIDKYDCLNDYFDIVTNPGFIAKKINSLYEEYVNRENRISRSREPLLLVVNNIKRLKEKIVSLKSATKLSAPKLSPEKEAMKQKLLARQAQGEDVSFLLEQLDSFTGNFGGGSDDFSDIKANDVMERLKYLIENGRRYSIFVVVTGNNNESIKDYVKNNKFVITNSNLSDIRNTCCSVKCEKPLKVFKNGLETIETDKPMSLNVKLYNYALKSESSYWKELINIIENN